jgi:hypothetical protein
MGDLLRMFFLGATVASSLAALLLLRQMRAGWPPPGLKRDEFFRRRLGLQPRRRLLPRLHLPQLRLRR